MTLDVEYKRRNHRTLNMLKDNGLYELFRLTRFLFEIEIISSMSKRRAKSMQKTKLLLYMSIKFWLTGQCLSEMSSKTEMF